MEEQRFSIDGADRPMRTFAPCDIEVLIWYHVRCEPHPTAYSPAVSSALKRFIRDRILEPNELTGSGYTTTARGKKWLEMILATPYPELLWFDPRDKCITV
jgi:hypothetical protein